MAGMKPDGLANSREILSVLARVRARKDAQALASPRLSDQFSEDVRWKLGAVAMIDELLALPAQAEALLKRAGEERESRP